MTHLHGTLTSLRHDSLTWYTYILKGGIRSLRSMIRSFYLIDRLFYNVPVITTFHKTISHKQKQGRYSYVYNSFFKARSQKKTRLHQVLHWNCGKIWSRIKWNDLTKWLWCQSLLARVNDTILAGCLLCIWFYVEAFIPSRTAIKVMNNPHTFQIYHINYEHLLLFKKKRLTSTMSSVIFILIFPKF